MSCPDKNQELDGLQVFVVGYYLVCVIAIVVCPILYCVYGSSTPLPPEAEPYDHVHVFLDATGRPLPNQQKHRDIKQFESSLSHAASSLPRRYKIELFKESYGYDPTK